MEENSVYTNRLLKRRKKSMKMLTIEKVVIIMIMDPMQKIMREVLRRITTLLTFLMMTIRLYLRKLSLNKTSLWLKD